MAPFIDDNSFSSPESLALTSLPDVDNPGPVYVAGVRLSQPVQPEWPKDDVSDLSIGVQSLSVHANFNSFIQLLPAEIISHILSLCIPPFSTYKWSDFDRRLPFKLASICSYLRQIVFSTPQIWNSGAFVLADESSAIATVQVMKGWLERSGSLPLYLCIKTSFSEESWDVGTRDVLMDVLLRHHNRWKQVDLRLSVQCYKYLSSSSRSFPLLEKLTIKKPAGGHPERLMDLMKSTPNLTELRMTRLYLRSVIIRWDSLTKLEIRQLFIDECLEIFKQSVNLVELTMRRIIRGNDGFDLPTHPLVLPNLTILDWYTDLDTNLQLFFSLINTPKLTHFRFMNPSFVEFPAEPIVDWITRSGCRLKVAIFVGAEEDFLLDLWGMLSGLTLIALPELQQDHKPRPSLKEGVELLYEKPSSPRWNEICYYLPSI